jgi:hypothetical protein
MADTGWLNLTTFTSVGGSAAWSNPGNAVSSDNTYATQTTVVTAANNGYLHGVQLASTVPSGATINGIEVQIEVKGSSTSCRFDTVQLIIAGTKSGSNLSTGTAPTTSDAVYTYGGATTLWGLTPSDTDVNGATFGVAFRFKKSGKGTVVTSVDQVQMKIYYTAGGGSSFIATPNKRFWQAVNRAGTY